MSRVQQQNRTALRLLSARFRILIQRYCVLGPNDHSPLLVPSLVSSLLERVATPFVENHMHTAGPENHAFYLEEMDWLRRYVQVCDIGLVLGASGNLERFASQDVISVRQKFQDFYVFITDGGNGYDVRWAFNWLSVVLQDCEDEQADERARTAATWNDIRVLFPDGPNGAPAACRAHHSRSFRHK